MVVYNLWNIYGNLQSYVVKRKLTCNNIIDNEEFTKNMRNDGLVLMECDTTLIILTNNESDIPGKKDQFVKTMNKIKKYLKNEVVLVSHKLITTGISNYVREMDYRILSCTFDRFVIDMTKAPLVPNHRILESDELNELMDQLKTDPTNLPSISVNDTQAIWVGAKLGDVILIDRPTESTGYSKFLRRVIY